MSVMILAYLLGGVGLGLGVFRAWKVFHWNLNLPGVTMALVKLIEDGNWDRGLKLCGAAPGALFIKMVEPTLRAGKLEARGGLYRAAAMREAYRESRAEALKLDKLGPLLSALAALLCLASGTLAVFSGAVELELAGAMVMCGGGLAAFSLRFSLKIRGRCDLHFDKLVEAATRTN